MRTSEKQFVTIKELSERWSCSYDKIHSEIISGNIPAFALPSSNSGYTNYRIPFEWVEAHEQGDIDRRKTVERRFIKNKKLLAVA